MKGKKLYYVPGLFSIIGLPILLFLIGPREPDRHTSITMRLPSDDHTAGKFNRDDLLASIKNKKIETIDLDYPSFVDYDEYYEVVSAHRFRFVTQEIERLAFTHDTSTVLKVDLGENMASAMAILSGYTTIWDFTGCNVTPLLTIVFMYYRITLPPITVLNRWSQERQFSGTLHATPNPMAEI